MRGSVVACGESVEMGGERGWGEGCAPLSPLGAWPGDANDMEDLGTSKIESKSSRNNLHKGFVNIILY